MFLYYVMKSMHLKLINVFYFNLSKTAIRRYKPNQSICFLIYLIVKVLYSLGAIDSVIRFKETSMDGVNVYCVYGSILIIGTLLALHLIMKRRKRVVRTFIYLTVIDTQLYYITKNSISCLMTI